MVGCLFIAVGLVMPPSLSVRAYDGQDSKGIVKISFVGDDHHTLTFTGLDREVTFAPIPLPAEVQEITISTDIHWDDGEANRRIQDESTQKLLDLRDVMKPLRERGRPFGTQVSGFLQAWQSFERRNAALLEDIAISMELGEMGTGEGIKAAERRLGFSLPEEYVSLWLEAGSLTIQDSHFLSPDDLDNAYAMMINVWETPKEELDRGISKGTKDLLQKSTLLFTEVGDGYGGLLFVPGQKEGKPSYYWIHQERIDEPIALEDLAGEPRDFAGAFRWIVATLAFSQLDDLRQECVVVDRSAAGVLPMKLERSRDTYFLMPAWSLYP